MSCHSDLLPTVSGGLLWRLVTTSCHGDLLPVVSRGSRNVPSKFKLLKLKRNASLICHWPSVRTQP